MTTTKHRDIADSFDGRFTSSCSLTETVEEDSEATATKQRSHGIKPAATQNTNANTGPGVCLPPEAAVDDYLRNFLLKMGMTRTLDCFQTEWNELLQRGLLNTQLVGTVPDVYTQNHRLDSELTNLHRERDQYESNASSTAETLKSLQKARDFHRMQHKRVLQEKNKLIEDVRKLKIQCGRYEPAVRRINERYQSIMRQKMLVSLERDKAVAQVHRLQATLQNVGLSEERQSLNQETGDARCKTKSQSMKTAPGLVKHAPVDSKFPISRRGNAPSTKERPADPPTKADADGFQLRSTIKVSFISPSNECDCLRSFISTRFIFTHSPHRPTASPSAASPATQASVSWRPLATTDCGSFGACRGEI